MNPIARLLEQPSVHNRYVFTVGVHPLRGLPHVLASSTSMGLAETGDRIDCVEVSIRTGLAYLIPVV